jgi:nucleotide sugar dehydrogenase
MTVMTLSRSGFVSAFTKGDIVICVIGLGRVGLPIAASFSKAGVLVIGVDIDENIVKSINAGKCQFNDEPGLEDLVATVVGEGRLKATTDGPIAIKQADVIIVCVPTPVDERKVPDYSAVIETCDNIRENMKKDCMVIIESTVGTGTVEDLIIPLLEGETGREAGVDFGVASCPERADPVKILHDLKTLPRIVGGINSESTEIASALYETAFGVKVVQVSSPKTANTVKLTENLFRDVNIALANEVAILFENLGIDTIEVINACSTKYNFLPHYPGAGVGGPCLPQNPYYLIVEGVKVGYIPYLVRMAREINDRMPDHVVMLVTRSLNEVGKTVKGSKIAILGIAYKPGIHDLQLTPVEKIFSRLEEMGASLVIYDPVFKDEEAFGVKVQHSLEEAVTNVDCIVIGTAHREFRNLDFACLSRLVNKPAAFVDSRHVAEPKHVKRYGFSYRGVGRG